MVTTDDTFAVLRTEIAEPLNISMKTFSGGELVQHSQQLTGQRRSG